MTNLLAQLAEPFEPKYISWKPGATKGDQCMAMAYADLRAYQERLDALLGLEWSIEYQPWGDNRIIARLTINGVTRASTGEMDAQDEKNGMGGTVSEAQAFKRAAAMFGLGRYLYDFDNAWVEFDAQRKRIRDAGLAQLDSRYKAWYARQSAQTPQPTRPPSQTPKPTPVDVEFRNAPERAAQSTADHPFAEGAPSADALAMIKEWRGPVDAQVWAVQIKACENEHHARESWISSVKACGGYTDKNKAQVFAHFAQHQLDKQVA